jgi:hypothetical protein
MMLDHSEAN